MQQSDGSNESFMILVFVVGVIWFWYYLLKVDPWLREKIGEYWGITIMRAGPRGGWTIVDAPVPSLINRRAKWTMSTLGCFFFLLLVAVPLITGYLALSALTLFSLESLVRSILGMCLLVGIPLLIIGGTAFILTKFSGDSRK